MPELGLRTQTGRCCISRSRWLKPLCCSLPDPGGVEEEEEEVITAQKQLQIEVLKQNGWEKLNQQLVSPPEAENLAVWA